LGLEVGRNTGVAQMGALGFLLMNSPTIGAAYEALVRYGHHYVPAWVLSMDATGNEAALMFSEGIPLAPFQVFAHDVVFAALATRWKTGARLARGAPVPRTRTFASLPRKILRRRFVRLRRSGRQDCLPSIVSRRTAPVRRSRDGKARRADLCASHSLRSVAR